MNDELNKIISYFSERVSVYIFQNNHIAIATPDEIIYILDCSVVRKGPPLTLAVWSGFVAVSIDTTPILKDECTCSWQ